MLNEIVGQKIEENLKNGNKVELAVWRAIKNEFLMFTKAENAKELTNEAEMKILSKMANQRKDSIEQYTIALKTAKNDKEFKKIKAILDNEFAERDVLESMLPKEPSDDEIENAVKGIVSELIQMNGSVSMRDMKSVQSMIRQQYSTVNGGKVADIFKKFI